jgi:TetR/AcrR family transcriptional repressor of nem operon
MADARDEAKRETREALITAAREELAENGLETASLDAICARAGYTRGAFYVHFKDREELIVAVVDRILTSFHDRVIAGEGAAEDLDRTIGQYVAMVLAGAPEVGGRDRWHFHHTLAACARSPVLKERYAALQRQAMERVTSAAKAGQRAGTVRDDVPAASLGEVLVILTMGIAAMVDLGIPFDLQGGAKALRRMVRAERAGKRAARRARRLHRA